MVEGRLSLSRGGGGSFSLSLSLSLALFVSLSLSPSPSTPTEQIRNSHRIGGIIMIRLCTCCSFCLLLYSKKNIVRLAPSSSTTSVARLRSESSYSSSSLLHLGSAVALGVHLSAHCVSLNKPSSSWVDTTVLKQLRSKEGKG